MKPWEKDGEESTLYGVVLGAYKEIEVRDLIRIAWSVAGDYVMGSNLVW